MAYQQQANGSDRVVMDPANLALVQVLNPATMLAAGSPVPFYLQGPRGLTTAEVFLAIRAARRAIADSEDMGDPRVRRQRADAYGALAFAYQLLGSYEARVARSQNPLRELQMLAALRQAYQLEPNEPSFMLELAQQYAQRGLVDAAQRLYRDAAVQAGRLAQAAPSSLPGGAGMAQVAKECARRADELNKVVEKRLDEYRSGLAARGLRREATRPDRGADARAQAALSLRLVDQAAEDLRELFASPSRQEAQARGFALQLRLFLELGQAAEALALLQLPNSFSYLGLQEYHRTSALVLAAVGRYAEAEEQCRRLAQVFDDESARQLISAGQLATLGGAFNLEEINGTVEPFGSNYYGVVNSYLCIPASAQKAEQLLLAGLLALERGDPPTAAAAFRQAVCETDPLVPNDIIAGRYYYLITGKFLDRPRGD